MLLMASLCNAALLPDGKPVRGSRRYDQVMRPVPASTWGYRTAEPQDNPLEKIFAKGRKFFMPRSGRSDDGINFCSSCGTSVGDGNFCSNCGAPIRRPPQDYGQQPPYAHWDLYGAADAYEPQPSYAPAEEYAPPAPPYGGAYGWSDAYQQQPYADDRMPPDAYDQPPEMYPYEPPEPPTSLRPPDGFGGPFALDAYGRDPMDPGFGGPGSLMESLLGAPLFGGFGGFEGACVRPARACPPSAGAHG